MTKEKSSVRLIGRSSPQKKNWRKERQRGDWLAQTQSHDGADKKKEKEERNERNRARERSEVTTQRKGNGWKNVAGRKRAKASDEECIRRGWSGRVKVRGRRETLRTCGCPFSILINANNELFSVWLGANPPRRGQPPPGPAYSCTNDRFHPLFSVPQSHTVHASPQPPNSSSRSHPRPTDRQSSCGFDSDEGEPQYRFRWDTCPSFFFLHRSSAVLAFRNPPVLSPVTGSDLLSFSLIL